MKDLQDDKIYTIDTLANRLNTLWHGVRRTRKLVTELGVPKGGKIVCQIIAAYILWIKRAFKDHVAFFVPNMLQYIGKRYFGILQPVAIRSVHHREGEYQTLWAGEWKSDTQTMKSR